MHNRRDPKVFDVFRINVISGEEMLIAQNPGKITRWITDHDGRLRVAVTTDGVNKTLLYREREADEFRAVVTTGFKETLAPQLFTFDNRKIFVRSNRGRDTTAIVIFNPVTASEDEVLFEHPDVDVSSIIYSRKRKVLTAITYETWKTQYKFLDVQTEEMFDTLRSKLPGYEVALKSCNRNEDKFVVVAHSDKVPGKTYLFDRTAGTLEFICDQAPWIPEGELAEMRPVQYTSRDGLTIHGYLTLPKGRAANSLPVVINPHGGPWYLTNQLLELNSIFDASTNAETASDLDSSWHEVLLSGCPNQRLNRMLGELRSTLRRYERFYMLDSALIAESAHQHRTVINAVLANDIAGAERALMENWRFGMETLLLRIGEA
jgi:dipeptidyl aminopeptidase/acylaminoacyl peptidase